jgi:hypothetical protein
MESPFVERRDAWKDADRCGAGKACPKYSKKIFSWTNFYSRIIARITDNDGAYIA